MGFRDSLRASYCLRIPNEKPERPLGLAPFWPPWASAIPSWHRADSEFRMKNPSAHWRSLLFGRTGRLKQGLAASGQRKTRQILAGFWLLVIPARFERATVCLEGRCSIQLSYGTEGAKIGRFRGKKPDRIGRMTNLDRIMRIQGFCPDAQEAWYL